MKKRILLMTILIALGGGLVLSGCSGKGETKDRADICRDPKGDRTEKGGQNCREAEGRGACGTDSGCVWRCCAAACVYLRT